MLGSSSELNLTYGNLYYLDVSINGQDINWTSPSGSTVNRVEFQSTNGQIPPAQLQFNAINASHVQNDAITSGKIAPNSINASHILDNIITAAKIVNDAITSAKIAPSAVNSSHLSAGLALTGNASIDGPTLFVDSTGDRVGIGTTNPTTKLEVAGDLNVTGYVKSGCPSDMVPVGNRAFCIDKYESSAASGSAGHYSGNDTTMAGSSSGVAPLASVTWFHAAVACANAGKRLCTNQEWTVACLGTPDTTTCNINSQGTPLNTGSLSNCKSRWGAYDMVGNVWEWVADWGQAGGISTTYSDGSYVAAWPGYGDGADGTWNINGRAYANAYGSGWTTGLPTAFIRGGGSGANAGCFAVNLNNAPSKVIERGRSKTPQAIAEDT